MLFGSEALALLNNSQAHTGQNDRPISICLCIESVIERDKLLYLKRLFTPRNPNITFTVFAFEEIKNTQAKLSDNDIFVVVLKHFDQSAYQKLKNTFIQNKSIVITTSTNDYCHQASEFALIELLGNPSFERELACEMVAVCPQQKIQIARVFSFVKSYVEAELIKACAKKNASLALLPFQKSKSHLMSLSQIDLMKTLASLNSVNSAFESILIGSMVLLYGKSCKRAVSLIQTEKQILMKPFKAFIAYGATVIIGNILKNYYNMNQTDRSALLFIKKPAKILEI